MGSLFVGCGSVCTVKIAAEIDINAFMIICVSRAMNLEYSVKSLNHSL